jgi:hypothetical protein
MNKRRLLLGASLVALLGLAGGLVVWLHLPRPGVTAENFYRLRLNMTFKEAVGLLGKPTEGGGLSGTTGYCWGYWQWQGKEVSIKLLFEGPLNGEDQTLTEGSLYYLPSGPSEEVPPNQADRPLQFFRRLLPW